MKLYIPTSSRNFNCIFSEESISPKSFYKARGFGYSNWHSIPENPYENCTVLYQDLAYYSRPDEGYDDYPFVVEIDVDERLISQMFYCDSSRAFLYDGVLYFNLKTASFYFFNPNHKDIALSKSSGSLETKLVEIYSKNIKVETPKGQYSIPREQEPILNQEELKHSQRINKLKGLFYGYYIGSLLSTSKEQAERINRYQSILNIASAIASSLDKQPTQHQYSQLRALCLDQSFQNGLANRFNISNEIAESIIRYFIDNKWSPDENTRRGYGLLNNIMSPDNQGAAIDWLTSQIEANMVSTGIWKIEPDRKEIEILPDTVVEINRYKNAGKDEQYRLMHYWINNVFSDCKYSGSLSSYRSDLATDLALSARDQVYGENWADSKTKRYINAIRRNIAGEEFSEKWSDGILCSVAAVLMKGDSWEGLRKFMLSQNLHDCSWAFGLFGMLNGFASIPRDFSDILFKNSEKKYIASVYYAISDMINVSRVASLPIDDNGDMPESICEPKEKKGIFSRVIDGVSEAVSSIVGKKEEEPAIDLGFCDDDLSLAVDKMNADSTEITNPQQIVEDTKTEPLAKTEDCAPENTGKFNLLMPDLINILDKNFSGNKKHTELVTYYTGQLLTICNNVETYTEMIEAVKGIKPHESKHNWKSIASKDIIKLLSDKAALEKVQKRSSVSQLSIWNQEPYEQTKKQERPSWQNNSSSGYFYRDPTAYDIIKPYVPKYHQAEFEKDFNFFISELRKPGETSEYYPESRVKRDDKSVIDAFCRFISSDKRSYSRKLNVDAIISALREYYQG